MGARIAACVSTLFYQVTTVAVVPQFQLQDWNEFVMNTVKLPEWRRGR
jgi:hypothetical protein